MSKIQFCCFAFLSFTLCILVVYMVKEDFPDPSMFDEETVNLFFEREFSPEKMKNFFEILQREEEKEQQRRFFESIPVRLEQPQKKEEDNMEEQPKKAEPKEEEEIPQLPPPQNPDYRPHWTPSPGLMV